MTTNTQNSYLNELYLKLNKVKTMKWLLGVENYDKEFVIEDLQKEIDFICYQNFELIVLLHHYLSAMTTKVKNCVNEIVEAKDNPKLCRKLYFNYLKNYNKEAEFKEFERYIYMSRANTVLKDLPQEENFENILDEACDFRFLQLIIIYNIINNNSSIFFARKDIIQNIPQLVYWIKENQYKPIEDLTTDECEILAGCMYGFSCDEMLEYLKLSSQVNNYKDINDIIKNLPAKFGVVNLTQVLFRTLLLKPHIWSQGDHVYVVEAIKGLNESIEISTK